MGKGRPSSLLFLIFVVSAIPGFLSAHIFNDGSKPDGPMRLELIHRHSPKLKEHGVRVEVPKTKLEHIKELQRHDVFRHQMISRKRHDHHHHQIRTDLLGRNLLETTASPSASIAMPLRAGWDFGMGQYLVQVKVGTPFQKFLLIADTGSDLTWMKCRHRCGPKCQLHKARMKHNNNTREFHATLSSTFKPIPCSSEMCKSELDFSISKCRNSRSPCRYDYRYADNSGALGFFANETITVPLTNGGIAKLNDVVVGCTEFVEAPEEANISKGDGVLGLGFTKHTFVAKAASSLGDKFSYCLIDHMSNRNVSSYLTFGGNVEPAAVQKSMSYTKLTLGGPKIGPFYIVNLMGISIGGNMLPIPIAAWEENLGGGAIVDSGTSLTFLTQPAYIPVMAELTKALSKFQRVDLDSFEFCFNSTGYCDSLVPKFAIHFADGVKFEPLVRSYVIDVADQTKCLGFQSAPFPGTTIIGNIMQQNHLWEYDLGRETLGFSPSSCTS